MLLQWFTGTKLIHFKMLIMSFTECKDIPTSLVDVLLSHTPMSLLQASTGVLRHILSFQNARCEQGTFGELRQHIQIELSLAPQLIPSHCKILIVSGEL